MDKTPLSLRRPEKVLTMKAGPPPQLGYYSPPRCCLAVLMMTWRRRPAPRVVPVPLLRWSMSSWTHAP